MIRETEFRNRMSWQSRLRDSATARLRDQRGSALAVVLVLVVVLTVAGAAMVNTALTEITIAYNTGDSAAAQYAAEAGLSRAMYELSQNAGWAGTTAAIGDARYVVTTTSAGSVRSSTATGTGGGGRRVLKAAVAAIPQSASTTVLANATATIGSATAGLTVRNDFPSSAASAVQANNKLAAATAMTVNTTGANIIGGLTANGTISGVTCGIWAWTCNVSATVRAIPEIDMDSAATTSLKYRAGISGSGTLTVNKPTGVVSGDLLIAAISVRAAAPATPSGWTLIWCQYSSSGSGSGGSTCPGGTPTVSLAVYRKVAGASEPASYSWTVANKAEGIIAAYYNVDTSNPINVENGASQTSSSTSLSTLAGCCTTTVANTMVVASFADGAGNTGFGTGVPGGIPTDMSEENEGRSGGTPTSSIAHAGVFDGIQDAIGATGQKTVTLTSAGGGVTHLLALKPQTATVSTSSGGSAP